MYCSADALVSGRLEFAIADSYESKHYSEVAVRIGVITGQQFAAHGAPAFSGPPPLLVDPADPLDIGSPELNDLHERYDLIPRLGQCPCLRGLRG